MTKKQHATIEELAQHARQLAAAFKILLVEDNLLCARPDHGAALQQKRVNADGSVDQRFQVITRVISDETTYAAALHEIGHCVSVLGFEASVTPLTKERAAWDWAREYALVWTVAMEQTEQYAYGTYERAARIAREQDAKRSVALNAFIKKIKL